MLLAFLVCSLVIGSVFTSPAANLFVDIGLLNLKNIAQPVNLSSVVMPNFSCEFSDKIFFIKTAGYANYTGGLLHGLDDVTRASECQGPFYSYGDPHINCTLALKNLTIEYKARMKYGILPKVNVHVRAAVPATEVFIDFVHPRNQKPRINRFKVLEVGKPHPKFTGLGPLNKQLGVLEEGFTKQTKAEMFDILDLFKSALDYAFSSVPWPIFS